MTWRLWWPYANKIIQRQSKSDIGASISSEPAQMKGRGIDLRDSNGHSLAAVLLDVDHRRLPRGVGFAVEHQRVAVSDGEHTHVEKDGHHPLPRLLGVARQTGGHRRFADLRLRLTVTKRTVTGVAPQFLDRCRDGLASLHYRVSTFDFFGARLALSF